MEEEEPRPESELWENLYEVCESRQIAEDYRSMIVDQAVAKAKDRRRMLELLVWFMHDTVVAAREIQDGGSKAESDAYLAKRINLLTRTLTMLLCAGRLSTEPQEARLGSRNLHQRPIRAMIGVYVHNRRRSS